MTTVELTRFRTRPGQSAALLAARPQMLDDFRSDRAGFDAISELISADEGELADRSPATEGQV